ncbi:MAG: hypothetical protein AB1589_43060 [Cyanobacteriota bacterium]
MAPIDKAQTAHQVYEDYDPILWKALYKMTPDANQRWIKVGRRLFERRTNIYRTQCELRSQKCRKALFRESVSPSTDNTGFSPEIGSRRGRCCDLEFKNHSDSELSETLERIEKPSL